MSHVEHQQAAQTLTIGFAVLTLSDTRNRDSDTSGLLIRERLVGQGHTLVADQIIRDEPTELNAVLDKWISDPQIDAIITNGGTGLSRRDQTIDVVEARLQRLIPGFGELFRMLSFKEIGPSAMLSRAVAGMTQKTLIVALPGSTAAVRLAMDELLLPQIRHIVREVRK